MSSLYGPVRSRGILVVSTQAGKISVTSISRQRAVVGDKGHPLLVRQQHMLVAVKPNMS